MENPAMLLRTVHHLFRLGPWLNRLTMANCECHNQRVRDSPFPENSDVENIARISGRPTSLEASKELRHTSEAKKHTGAQWQIWYGYHMRLSWGYPEVIPEVILRLYHDIRWYIGYHAMVTIWLPRYGVNWGYIIRLCLKCLSESQGPDHARGLSIVVRFRVPPGISRWELATKKCLQLGIWFVMFCGINIW